MTLEDRFEIPDDVVARKVDDELVILGLASGAYYGLDPVGARIWELVEGGHRLAEISEILSAEYDVSTEIMAHDLLELVADLQKNGLVRPRA